MVENSKGAIVKVEPGNVLSVRELYSDMDRAYRFAKAMALGAGMGNTEQAGTRALAQIITGAELGIPPGAAVRGIHFIKEKIGLAADLMAGLAKSEGWELEVQHSDPLGEWCKVTATHEQHKPYSFTWTMDMAKQAGLVRPDSGWVKFKWDMLYARAVSHVCRKVAPGRLMGLYTVEELKDEDMPLERAAADDKLLQRVIEEARPAAEVQPPADQGDAGQGVSANQGEDADVEKDIVAGILCLSWTENEAVEYRRRFATPKEFLAFVESEVKSAINKKCVTERKAEVDTKQLRAEAAKMLIQLCGTREDALNELAKITKSLGLGERKNLDGLKAPEIAAIHTFIKDMYDKAFAAPVGTGA